MTIYAVMKTGGKEYRVAPGDVVRVEKLAAAPGATIEIREVYLIGSGQDVTVGSPTVPDARVIAEVVEESGDEEIFIFKKKRGNRYQMTIGQQLSYTALRIREIVVGKSVYEAAAPRREVAAAPTPPPPPPRTSKPKRNVPEPQAKKRLQLQPRTPPEPPAPAPVELPLPMPAQGDAPFAPKVASDEHVGSPPHAPQPRSDAVHPVRAETAAPVPTRDNRGPGKRSHAIAPLVVALLLIAAGLLVWFSRQPGGTVDVATVAAPPQAAGPFVPQPAAKAPPRKETAIKNPAAASAPSAPVQPPE
jgi:large subunit ribosomal protein L21